MGRYGFDTVVVKLCTYIQFVYNTNRPAFLESDLLGLCVDSNW